MQEALGRRSDPQTPLAVAEQPFGIELSGGWKRIRLVLPVDEQSDSAWPGDPERAVVAFDQSRNTM